jgi:hypothetical protein
MKLGDLHLLLFGYLGVKILLFGVVQCTMNVRTTGSAHLVTLQSPFLAEIPLFAPWPSDFWHLSDP